MPKKKPAVGDGTPGMPYEIGNADEFFWFAGLVNGTLTDGTPKDKRACAILTSDIAVNRYELSVDEDGNPLYNGRLITDLYSPNEWIPIGVVTASVVSSGNYYIYDGTFDGNGHKISGVYINKNADYQGVFGYTNSNSVIKNLEIVGSYIKGRNEVGGIVAKSEGSIFKCRNQGIVVSVGYGLGGICGFNEDGKIAECENVGSVSSFKSFTVGGICGSNSGTIENCHNQGLVTADNTLGGICGRNYSILSGCYNTGDIITTQLDEGYKTSYLGGIAGDNSGNITFCFNSGQLKGWRFTGGICGRNFDANTTTNPMVSDCYNIGNIASNEQVGGVCGYQYLATLKDCYNAGKVIASGTKNIGGVCGEMAGDVVTVFNCYYLSSAAKGGINGEDRTGSAKPLMVNNLTLSNTGFNTQVWGQILPNKQETSEGFIYHLPYLANVTPNTLYPILDDYGQSGTIVGIHSVSANPISSVYSVDGAICISNTDAKAEIYDVNGILRIETFARVIHVSHGIYYVKIENDVNKVIVE